MASIRVENFGGMAPRRSVRLLPQNFAQLAENTKLFSGELRGWTIPKLVQDFTADVGDVKSVYRLPAEAPHPVQWLRFASDDVDFVRAPLVNDAFDRVYWTGEQAYPAYTTRARITADDPPLRLGVPRPTTPPTLGTTGGSGDTETRFYVYTFVSEFGEEGQPSDVAEITGPSDATSWDLSNLETTVPNPTERSITHKNIYRTVVGETTTAFFFVDQIDLAVDTYTDVKSNTDVALNPLLESTSWAQPPDELKGLVSAANGYLLGFVGRDLYFSEQYRPHAWPADYVVSTEFPIVGLGVFGNSVAVMTSSAPYVVTGVAPESTSLTKMNTTEPCLSKKSIVSTPVGVYYASDNGLVLVSPAGYNLVSRELLTEDEWRIDYKPTQLQATRYGTRYFARNLEFSFLFDHAEPNSAITHVDDLVAEVGGPELEPIDNLQTDYYTGDVYIIYQKQVYEWDPEDTTPLSYTWRSKEFEFPRPINLGAGVIQSNATVRFSDGYRQQLADHNQACIDAGSLNTLNDMALNDTKLNSPLPSGLVQSPKTPLGGSHLFLLSDFADVSGVFQLKVYAGQELVVDAQGVPPEMQFRVPSGVKSRSWSFELHSNTPCYSVTLAETGKELGRT